MTENQWPQDGSYSPPPAAGQKTDAYGNPLPPAGQPVTSMQPSSSALDETDQFGTPGTPGAAGSTDTSTGSSSGMGGKADVAKEEASDVARHAADAAQGVAGTAKEETANVAREVKSNARDLLYQARSDLTDQAGAQQQKVAQGIRSISEELRTMAEASDEPGVASDLVRQVADRSASVASWLDGRDPGSLLDEVKSFARQRPGTFLLLAAGAGVLAGRLTRGLAGGAGSESGSTTGTGSETYRAPTAPRTSAPGGYAAGGTVPPPVVDLPGPDVTTAGTSGSGTPLRPEDERYLSDGGRQI